MESDASGQVAAALVAREEQLSLRAMAKGRARDIAAIHHYRRQHMSRKRLIEIYGPDIVNLALGGGSE